MLVAKVQDGTPANDAGLLPDDLLLGINSRPVSSVDDLQRLMALATEDEVHLDVLRKGRREGVSARARNRREPAAA